MYVVQIHRIALAFLVSVSTACSVYSAKDSTWKEVSLYIGTGTQNNMSYIYPNTHFVNASKGAEHYRIGANVTFNKIGIYARLSNSVRTVQAKSIEELYPNISNVKIDENIPYRNTLSLRSACFGAQYLFTLPKEKFAFRTYAGLSFSTALFPQVSYNTVNNNQPASVTESRALYRFWGKNLGCEFMFKPSANNPIYFLTGIDMIWGEIDENSIGANSVYYGFRQISSRVIKLGIGFNFSVFEKH